MVPVTVTSLPAGPATGFRAIEGAGVTVNVAASDAAPLVACTVAVPRSDVDGTANVAEKVPVEVALMEVGFVVADVPLKVTTTGALGG